MSAPTQNRAGSELAPARPEPEKSLPVPAKLTRLFVFFSVRSKFCGTNLTDGKAPFPVEEEKFEHVAPLLISKRESAER